MAEHVQPTNTDKKRNKKSFRPLLSTRSHRKRKIFFDASHPHKLTSRQWVIYCMYCWGFFALGIFTSAPGPILPTLESQVDVSLAIISYIFSARAVGFVLGSILSGYVLDRYQKHLISPQNGTKYLLQRKQLISDYLWSLPKWNCNAPISSHNVFSISMLIAAITNAFVPYVHDVYSLSVLVSINGICFGNINTFGNVLLLTLFDTEISHDINFNLIYPTSKSIKEEVESTSSTYGSLSRDSAAEATAVRAARQEERVGPFMQFLQAIYALGGFIAPIVIRISFEISDSYAYAFWLFTLLYIPPALVLFYYPEPVRMSTISLRLKEIQKENESAQNLQLLKTNIELDELEINKVARANIAWWSIWLCGGFASFLLWYVGAQVGYGMYITTYAIDYLKTSAACGRYLASANWFGLFVGRFVAVPLSHKMSALNMVRLDLIGTCAACALLFFSLRSAYIAWLSSIIVGFCMASVWPSMFVWAETLIPVTGIFASIMVGGGSVGEFVIPAFLGNIMAAFGDKYFNHVMLAMSIFLIVNLWINQIIAKRLTRAIENNMTRKVTY